MKIDYRNPSPSNSWIYPEYHSRSSPRSIFPRFLMEFVESNLGDLEKNRGGGVKTVKEGGERKGKRRKRRRREKKSMTVEKKRGRDTRREEEEERKEKRNPEKRL